MAALHPAGRFTVAPDHPCLPGHFPGRPLVPGVLLLEEALALVLARLPGRRLAGLASAKLTAPVLPGQEVEVACEAAPGGAGRVEFACTVAGSVVARGVARLAGEAA